MGLIYKNLKYESEKIAQLKQSWLVCEMLVEDML